MKPRNTHTVPEGYFGSLEERLSQIPKAAASAAVSPWTKVRPYLAMVAAFAALVIGGTAILRNTVRPASGLSDEDLLGYIGLIPSTDPYLLFDESGREEAFSDEDIIDYLIETGVSLEQLAYAQEN